MKQIGILFVTAMGLGLIFSPSCEKKDKLSNVKRQIP